VQTLLDAGAKVKDEDIRGMTPLVFAVSSERPDPAVVRLLLKAGADVNAKTKNRRDRARLGQEVRQPGRNLNPDRRRRAGGRAIHRARAAADPSRAYRGGIRASRRRAGEKAATEFFQQSGCVGCIIRISRSWRSLPPAQAA